MFTSCQDDYDDTALWDAVNDHEERLAALEKWQEQVNQNIQSLHQLINTTDYITSVTPLVEGGQEVGYTITFLHSDPINIYHGKQGDEGDKGEDGDKGDDGHTPQIGLTKGTDGNWYWTLDGELMLDEEHNPIRANGEDGQPGQQGQQGQTGQTGAPAPTPQISLGSTIESGTVITDSGKKDNNVWYLSVDGGKTWYRISGDKGATGDEGEKGDKGDSMFADNPITEEGNYYIFHLADGKTTFSVPKYQALTIGTGTGTLEVPKNGTTDITLAFEDEYEALVAKVTPEDGHTAISTRATSSWSVTASLADKTVTVTTSAANGKAMLDVSLLRADGSKLTASRVLEVPIVKGGQTLTKAGDYTMRGNYSQGITISGDGINLTLDGAAISTSGIGSNITGGNPTIQVLGTENSVTSATSTAIHVGSGCTLSIEGVNGTADKLKAEGGKIDGTMSRSGNAGAGIGSSNGGNIVIRNVTIEAKGNTYSHFTGPQSGGSAAIGSSVPGYCGDITIDNATIIATGGYRAAAIGMSGCLADSYYPDLKIGKIHISHSVITAQGGDGASAIGLACMEDASLSSAYAGEIHIETDETSTAFLGRLTSSGNFKIGKGKHYSDRMTFYNQDGSGTWPGVTLKASDDTQTSTDGIN